MLLLPDETYEGHHHSAASPPHQAPALTLRGHRVRADFFCVNRKPPAHHREEHRTRRWCRESRRLRRDRPLSRLGPSSISPVANDASSSNEAVHLQRRLLSLSTELVTLRNHLHDAPAVPPRAPPAPPAPPPDASPQQADTSLSDTKWRSGSAPCVVGVTPVAAAPPTGRAASADGGAATVAADVEDLIHLVGPLTENCVVRILQTRFYQNKFYTWIGPILVALNGYTDTENPLTLKAARAGTAASSEGARGGDELSRVVRDAVRHQADTGYPQAIILSGVSGSGKTHASMALLRRLFDAAGGGAETDAFKHLAAAFTVLRSLGTAHTATNHQSSRIGHFIEVQVTDGALYRTKIHCYFLDQTRVVRPLPGERNYHIFYQMLAGLTAEERTRLQLDGYSAQDLRYLNPPSAATRRADETDAARFQAWRSCLGVLGIPFLDVVRVLAAVLLLGNVNFVESPDGGAEPATERELGACAALLGVPPAALIRGLASRHPPRSRPAIAPSPATPAAASSARDALAKALYCRTVATIVRRANSLKRLGSTLGTLSSDSNESMHGRSVRSGGGAGAGSMAALNDVVRHATDGFVGILDMFGFEDAAPSRLEHLCANLCAETMQHFYNTHVFKSSAESCREEGVHSTAVHYADNVPVIDLVSSLRGGLLAALDAECASRGSPERYATRVRTQHAHHPRLLEARPPHARRFAVRHYAGDVTYDANDFLEANRDAVPAELVAAFERRCCEFGFATHLFGAELKSLAGGDGRGALFRASPSAHASPLDPDAPSSSLTQDFHTRLDNLLRTLVHARPHFVRCVRANDSERSMAFDAGAVTRQVRALQVLETSTLMSSGYPHRMRFRAFLGRYRAMAGGACGEEGGEASAAVLRAVEPRASPSPAAVRWAIGKRHVFLSEGMRQALERVRAARRRRAATIIQRAWRSHREIPKKSRPAPIAGTPPPEPGDKCDPALMRHACTLFGLDLERPPPLPPSRTYTVSGGVKLSYPQSRVVAAEWTPPDASPAATLHKGDTVTVLGAARRGHLAVQVGSNTVAVPHHVLAPPRGPPSRPGPPPPAPA